MKKILVALAILVSSYSYATDPTVNEKVLKSFSDAFPHAEKVSWSAGTHSYEVAFVNDDIRYRLWYNEVGQITRLMRYYTAENLSPFILSKINESYSDKDIFGVTEVSTDTGIVYKVILQDEKNWFHVTSDAAGNLTMDKKYKKA